MRPAFRALKSIFYYGFLASLTIGLILIWLSFWSIFWANLGIYYSSLNSLSSSMGRVEILVVCIFLVDGLGIGCEPRGVWLPELVLVAILTVLAAALSSISMFLFEPWHFSCLSEIEATEGSYDSSSGSRLFITAVLLFWYFWNETLTCWMGTGYCGGSY